MLVTVYEDHWVRTPGMSRLDPTRMAQGIMTGIGFLGAGVIVKEGLNVRGLTTAASIWITAAIGILAGVGLYLPLVVSVVLTLSVLVVVPLDRNARTHAGLLQLRREVREAKATCPKRQMRELISNTSSASPISATGSKHEGARAAAQHDTADHGSQRGSAPRADAQGKSDRTRVQSVAHRRLRRFMTLRLTTTACANCRTLRETRALADRLEKVTMRAAFTDEDKAFIQRCRMFFHRDRRHARPARLFLQGRLARLRARASTTARSRFPTTTATASTAPGATCWSIRTVGIVVRGFRNAEAAARQRHRDG